MTRYFSTLAKINMGSYGSWLIPVTAPVLIVFQVLLDGFYQHFKLIRSNDSVNGLLNYANVFLARKSDDEMLFWLSEVVSGVRAIAQLPEMVNMMFFEEMVIDFQD